MRNLCSADLRICDSSSSCFMAVMGQHQTKIVGATVPSTLLLLIALHWHTLALHTTCVTPTNHSVLESHPQSSLVLNFNVEYHSDQNPDQKSLPCPGLTGFSNSSFGRLPSSSDAGVSSPGRTLGATRLFGYLLLNPRLNEHFQNSIDQGILQIVQRRVTLERGIISQRSRGVPSGKELESKNCID
jgi:hypothetical protein